MTDVAFVTLSGFDGYVYFSKKDDPTKIYTTFGWSFSEYLLYDGYNVGDVEKIYTNQEQSILCFLLGQSQDRRVYCKGTNNTHQLGNGQNNKYYDSGFVVGSDWTTGSQSMLTNVHNLSMNKRSLCAIVADDENNPNKSSLYCWGSSIFGQMGFDNGHDDDVSYYDTTLLWDGVSADNAYFDAPERLELIPRKITEIEEEFFK